MSIAEIYYYFYYYTTMHIRGYEREVDITWQCMAFHTYIEDMDETIQQYLRRTRESNKKEMIAIIRYLLEGKFDTTIARGSYCRFIYVT